MIPLGVLAQRQAASAIPSGTLVYSTTVTSTAAAAVQSFIGVDILDPSPSRTVVLAVCAREGSSFTGVTIGSESAILRAHSWDGTAAGAAIYTADIPAGTEADIAVSTSASMSACDVAVWAAYGTLTYSTSAVGFAGTATLDAPANARSFVAYSASNTLSTLGVAGFTVRHPTSPTSGSLRIVGDAQPSTGSHTVSVGAAPNFWSVLLVADFALV